jgi:hypothetical protein
MYPLRVMPKRFAARVTRLIVSVGIEMANFTDGRPSASGNFFTRRPIEGNASEEHPPV